MSFISIFAKNRKRIQQEKNLSNEQKNEQQKMMKKEKM